MPREFLIRTEDDTTDMIVEAIAGRENELASYDANVTAYEAQIAALNAELPADWSGAMAKFKGKTPEQVLVIGGTEAELNQAVKMNYRDRITLLLFTEKAERMKSEWAYQHVKSQLTTDQTKRQKALDRYAAKLAAQKANNP